METQESKDLVVRKPKKLGYAFLIFVFIASIAGSIYFFSEGKLGEFVPQKGKETQMENTVSRLMESSKEGCFSDRNEI